MKKSVLTGALATLLFSFPAAQAAEPGLYVGGSVGQTNVDTKASEFDFKGSPDFKIDDDDVGLASFQGCLPF